MPQSLLILGASVRAAAQSAAQAGYHVTAIDLFGDEDLRACATAVIVVPRESYPHGLAEAAEALPASPWMYTGGLENYPELVARISLRHQLLGNRPDVLRGVRDPFRVVNVLRTAGFNYLPVCSSAREIPPGETWLKKPLRSSGGEHVRFVRPKDAATDSRAPVAPSPGTPGERRGEGSTHYYQRYQSGLAASASYVAAGGLAVLLGVSEQLLGQNWGARAPFMYAGSIGPLVLSAKFQTRLEQLGNVLAAQFQLVGLFGVDGVITDDTFWPVEINPRYTASAEIYERARGGSLIAAQVAACVQETLPTAPSRLPDQCWGKAILYAPYDGILNGQLLSSLGSDVADIPLPSTSFQAGEPILTLFASAPINHVRSLLETNLRRVSNSLQAGPKSR